MADQFLSPSSPLTPGVAGVMTMTISNTFTTWLITGSPAWLPLVPLGISFVFGLLIFGDQGLARWKRPLYWIINSLIIFTVATGSTEIGRKATHGFASEAWAQPDESEGWCCRKGRLDRRSADACDDVKGRYFAEEDEDEARRSCDEERARRKRRFFDPWFR